MRQCALHCPLSCKWEKCCTSWVVVVNSASSLNSINADNREPKPQFSEFAVYTSEERSKNTHGLVEKMLNSASQKRPNSENQTRLCCLHDLYQIRNIVIFVMIVEFESACKHSAHLQPHSCYEKPF